MDDVGTAARLSQFFSESAFMPHGHCYLWNPALVATHVTSDWLIGSAYFSISLSLYALVRRIQIPFSAMVLSFGVFIGACGLTHFMEIWNLWEARYWLAGAIKVITAIASVATGVWLIRLKPRVIEMAASVRLSEQRRSELEALTKHLESRIHERTQELERLFRELGESKAMLETVLLQMPVGVIIAEGANGDSILINSEAMRILGMAPAPGLNRLTDGQRIDLEGAPLAQALHHGRFLRSAEIRHRIGDGAEATLLVSSAPVVGTEGRSQAAVVTFKDITERKRALEELRESQERYELATAAAHIGAWKWDLRTGIAEWTEIENQIFGFPAGTRAITVESIFARMHPQDIGHVRAHIEESLRIGSEYHVEFRVIWPDGGVRWVAGRGRPLRRAGRTEADQVFGVNFDITAQKEAEIAVRKALRARDEFISIASHELKTPLTSLSYQFEGMERTLRKTGAPAVDPQRLKQLMEVSLRQLDRLSRLVDDMLDVSRIATGRLTLQREASDLAELVADVLDRLSDQLNAAGCEVRRQLPAGVMGSWDRLRIEQVVGNLLTNVIKYAAGRPVDVALNAEAGKARLEVRDHGRGIPVEAQEKIFQRFERCVLASDVSGLGLGLYISREIVERHGGQISVQSSLGEGATFIVDLPMTN